MGRHPFRFLAAFLIALVAIQAHPQTPDQAPAKTSTISVITVTGTSKFPADQLIAASGLKVGDVVTADQLQAAANRLAEFGLFANVNYRYTSKGDAISLEFQVVEAPTVPLWFDNFPWFTDAEIAAAIHADVGLFTGDAPEDGVLLDRITDVLYKLLSTRNINGTVKHQLIPSPIDDGMIMLFRLDGAALNVQSLQFGHPLAAGSEKLKDRAPDIVGQGYSRMAIEVFENEQIRPIYASQGYLRAKIGPAQSHLVVNLERPTESAVEVTMPIAPGPAYSWSGVEWKGNTVIPSSNLNMLAGFMPGQVADSETIEAAWRRIVAEYGHRGYIEAKVVAEPQFDDAVHNVTYHVTVTEGPQYRMGEIVVTGLSYDAEERLRHVWQLVPGQVFDGDYFERMLPLLAKPNADIFPNMPIHYTEFGHWLRTDPARRIVDVLLDFK